MDASGASCLIRTCWWRIGQLSPIIRPLQARGWSLTLLHTRHTRLTSDWQERDRMPLPPGKHGRFCFLYRSIPFHGLLKIIYVSSRLYNRCPWCQMLQHYKQMLNWRSSSTLALDWNARLSSLAIAWCAQAQRRTAWDNGSVSSLAQACSLWGNRLKTHLRGRFSSPFRKRRCNAVSIHELRKPGYITVHVRATDRPKDHIRPSYFPYYNSSRICLQVQLKKHNKTTHFRQGCEWKCQGKTVRVGLHGSTLFKWWWSEFMCNIGELDIPRSTIIVQPMFMWNI